MTQTLDDARLAALDADLTEVYLNGAFDGAHETPIAQPTDLTYLQGYINGLRNLLEETRKPEPQTEYEAIEF
jgi:hypothetical protein